MATQSKTRLALDELASSDHLTRLRRAEVLGRTRDPTELAIVVASGLDDPRPNVVAECARLVAQRRLHGHTGQLLRVTGEPNRPVRVLKAAVNALGCLAASAPETPDWMSQALEAMAPLATHPNTMLRRTVMEAAGELGCAALPLLCRGLADTAWQVRMYAAMGLGGQAHCPAEANGALVVAFGAEGDTGTAEQMLRSMAELAVEAPPLAAKTSRLLATVLLDTSRPHPLRKAAARGIGEIGLPCGVPVLRRALADVPPPVAEQISWALAQMATFAEGGA